MKTKLSLVTLALLLLSVVALADDDAGRSGGLASRSFKLTFRSPERAAVVIKPLVSAEGSISLQPANNTLVVTDHPENLRSISEALQKFDAPSKPFRVELKLVAASRADTPQPVSEDLKEVASKLGAVLRFNSFEKLGEFVAEGKEGDALANLKVGDTYRADLKFGEFDPVSEGLRLQDLQLSRIQQVKDGETEAASLLKRTSLNVKLGQTLILGAQRVPESDRALMLILIAHRAE
jgi:type II/III secretion system protein